MFKYKVAANKKNMQSLDRYSIIKYAEIYTGPKNLANIGLITKSWKN